MQALPAALLIAGATLLAVHATHLEAARQSDADIEARLAFLSDAKIVSSTPIGKGVTGALRLTLSDGRMTHDASFQSIDEKNSSANMARGRRIAGELRFVDSYRYNIAAWRLARALGLAAMMPPTVERAYAGRRGALSWWVDDVLMDEAERERTSTEPPDPLDIVRQRMRMRVFAEVLGDTDRNKGNVLYTRDWRVVMIDFTRAFRLERTLRHPDMLTTCDRALLGRLRTLDRRAVETTVGSYLTGFEIDALLVRRDLIVSRIDRLVAERGEAVVLY